MPRTAAERKELMENPQLMQAGDQLVQHEIEEHRRRSTSSEAVSPTPNSRALSPTTHTVQLGDEHQRETFV